MRLRALGFTIGLAGLLGLSVQTAYGYEIVAANGVRSVGSEALVYDHSAQKCFGGNYVDYSPRAYIDAMGRVRLTIPHPAGTAPQTPANSTIMQGTDLYSLINSCTPVLTSDEDPRPEMFNDHHWMGATYINDNATKVWALYYTEYHGSRPGPQPPVDPETDPDRLAICPSRQWLSGAKAYPNCMQYSTGLAVSTDGSTFSHAPPPADPAQPLPYLVANLPYKYQPDWGFRGVAPGSNIFRKLKPGHDDGYYYVMMVASEHGAQKRGGCLMRTNNLDDAKSWRAWDGTGFNGSFIDPYRSTESPDAHVCEPIAPDALGNQAGTTITYNTYLGKYLMVGWGQVFNPDATAFNRLETQGFWYSLSDNLIDWTSRRTFLKFATAANGFGNGTNVDDCKPLAYGVVVDPDSPGRNFEQSDRRMELLFRRMNSPTCGQNTADRDLVRVPVELTKLPSAALTPLATAVTAPGQVTFSATGSSDPDGTIVNYKWDLDGNGSFETDTGSSVGATKTYTASDTGQIRVGLQVTDDSGAVATTHKTVIVNSRINFQPSASQVPSGYTKDSGEAFDATQGFGWIRQDSLSSDHVPLDLSLNGRERNSMPDQRLDTFVWMQWPGGTAPANSTPGAWEIEVPNGTYTVTVSAGDPAPIAQQFSDDGITTSAANHRIKVEGQVAISQCIQSFAPVVCPGTVTVDVTDGRLTIDATEGFNARLNYADIDYVAEAPAASFTAAPDNPAQTRVKFDASGSRGAIVRYEWDIDGNGIYERDAGPRAVTWEQFTAVGPTQVGLRVTDSAGATNTLTKTIGVDGRFNFQPCDPARAPALPCPAIAGTSSEVDGYLPDHGFSFQHVGRYRERGWVKQTSLGQANVFHEPLYIAPNAVDRGVAGVEARRNRLIRMQATDPNLATESGAWEISALDGTYTVTVGVGDALFSEPSSHQIRVEGQNAFASPFIPSAGDTFRETTKTVTVADGRLTVDPGGGTNTKLNYIEIDAAP
jgi:YD repeat-containing protein